MNLERTEFLSWKTAPARLTAHQAAWFLGFEPHEIPILVGAGVLKPLGHPSRNGVKHFATSTLEQLRRDEKWLAKATNAVRAHWRGQNVGKRAAVDRRRPTGLGTYGTVAFEGASGAPAATGVGNGNTRREPECSS